MTVMTVPIMGVSRRAPQRRRRPVLERFLAKVAIQPDGCLLWTAAVDRHGYGGFRAEQDRWVTAHRWYYQHINGPVPEGLELDHLCRVRACVNPAHLRPVTRRENQLAPGSESDSAKHANQTVCSRGHEYLPTNVQPSATAERVRRCRACSNAVNRARRLLTKTGIASPEATIQAYADRKYAAYAAEYRRVEP